MLVCIYTWGGQGAIARSLFAVDFTAPAKPREMPLLTVWNELLTCGGKQNSPVQQSVIDAVNFADLNGDGIPDISILAHAGTITLTDAERAACYNSYKPHGETWKTQPAVRTPAYRIDYFLRGKQLVLSPRSVSLRQHFPNADAFR